MFGINEIHKESKFRYLKYGYYYRIRAIDWDGRLCDVYFEVINNKTKVVDVLEVRDLVRSIITDILGLEYFTRMKIEKYCDDVCLNKIEENIYELNFVTEERKLHPIILLNKYCNGHEVQVLSGELKEKKGIYRARLNDVAERGFVELIEIDGHTYNLKDYEFQFIDNRKQISWKAFIEN